MPYQNLTFISATYHAFEGNGKPMSLSTQGKHTEAEEFVSFIEICFKEFLKNWDIASYPEHMKKLIDHLPLWNDLVEKLPPESQEALSVLFLNPKNILSAALRAVFQTLREMGHERLYENFLKNLKAFTERTRKDLAYDHYNRKVRKEFPTEQENLMWLATAEHPLETILLHENRNLINTVLQEFLSEYLSD